MENELIEQQIRARAYELWEKDGSPEGRDDEYWERARALVEAERSAEASKNASAS